MDLIGSSFPMLENASLAKMQEIEYPARDNYKIPAFLTRQDPTAKNLPFIIFVHGGPWEQDYWGFDNYVQFLPIAATAYFNLSFEAPPDKVLATLKQDIGSGAGLSKMTSLTELNGSSAKG